jgi:hypothetical protein
MGWLWGGGGITMFDVYSFHHLVWLTALTLVNVAIFGKRWWISTIIIIIGWEIFEGWAAVTFKNFPFVGKEEAINKVIGDSISDIVGVILALFSIKRIEKRWKRIEFLHGSNKEMNLE